MAPADLKPLTPLLLAAALGACSDALDQNTVAGQVVAVLNAGSRTLTLVDAVRFEATSWALAPGVPAGLDARGSRLAIALGDSDLVQAATPLGPGPVIRLARGADPVAVAIQDDSIAWVANSGLNTVSRINLTSGDTASFAVGVHPQGVLLVNSSLLYVLNGNLSGGVPAGPSSISWRNLGNGAGGSGTIVLTGTNARSAVLGEDGLVYVVAAGSPGAGDGRLAIVDPAANREVAVLNGLGESPGPAAYHPSGRLLIASSSEGILEVNTSTRSLVRGPGQGVKPGGEGVAAVLVDPRGRVWAASPRSCNGPGTVYVLRAPPDYGEIEALVVGVCPVAAALATVPPVP
ncbi:MAG TPA: hypothetical protein VNI61_00765 [Gemmatimonadales bacterium]|nr:hypothetical protein [Gemmatimonadales bacterium]